MLPLSPHMGWRCQGRSGDPAGGVAGVEGRVLCGVSGRRGVRVGATIRQPHMRDPCGSQDWMGRDTWRAFR
jgi:hypothetical protein